jgi:hypothetical protein
MSRRTSLSDIEKAAEAEHRRAVRFVNRQGVGSLPGSRLPNGESAGRQQVGHHGNASAGSGKADPGLGRKHRDTVSYDSFGGAGGFEEMLVEQGAGYTPLVGRPSPPPSVEDLERRARMHHVLSFLPDAYVLVLERKHLEQMTLQAIADEDGVSRQAVHKRLRKAEQLFAEMYEDHWNDDLPVGQLT